MRSIALEKGIDPCSVPHVLEARQLKLSADPKCRSRFLLSQHRNPLLVKMGFYILLASSLISFAISLSFLLSPPTFPIYPFPVRNNSTSTDPRSQWNLLYHLGGNGPWIPRVDDVVEGGVEIPDGCKIDMIHMVCLKTI